jgi:glutathione S-transferase
MMQSCTPNRDVTIRNFVSTSTDTSTSTSTSTGSIIDNTPSSPRKKKFRYLSAWFCPFAHRATIALEHHKDSIEYEWIEALGWHHKPVKEQHESNNHNKLTTTDPISDNSENDGEWYYHWKSDELKQYNPSALVPTLIPIQDDGITMDGTKAVWESLVVVDYIDAVSGTQGIQQLNAIDPYERARSRIWCDKINKECCSPYYDILVRQDPIEQKQYYNKLIDGLIQFSNELKKTSGPLFLPNYQLSIVDIALIPWAYRYYVLSHYRGMEYAIPNLEELHPYHDWYQYVMHDIPAVRVTLPDREKYLQHIKKYADGTARSKVANAVRRGVSAHDFDDHQDDYDNISTS